MVDSSLETKTDPFWFNDYSILFDKERIVEFFPVLTMTNNEKMNAIMRFTIYSTVILLLYHKNLNVLLIPFFVSLVTLYVYKFNNVEDKTIEKENFTLFECQAPSDNNPFMNTLVTDVGVYKPKKEACLVEQKEKEIENEFHKGLYKDINDIYDKNNSQRQFFTMPNTKEYGIKHGDTGKFANWLYNLGQPTCKEDTKECTNSFTYFENDERRYPRLLLKEEI
jgi:hypothetical protein